MILVFLLGFIPGCVSATTQKVPLATGALKADQSRVFVYSIGGLGGLSAKISDGDSAIGDLADHGYVCWDRAPGKVVIRAIRPHGKGVWGDSEAELSLDLIGGQTYYVQACMENTAGPLNVVSPLAASASTTFALVSRPQQEAAAVVAQECKAPVVPASNGR